MEDHKDVTEVKRITLKKAIIIALTIFMVVGALICCLSIISYKNLTNAHKKALKQWVNNLINKKQVEEDEYLNSCESNLKRLATALEMYSQDYNGDYPPSLKLMDQFYGGCDTTHVHEFDENGETIVNTLICPKSSYDYIYKVSNNFKNYTLWCGKEKTHVKSGKVYKEGCWPQYSPGKRIMYKP